MRDIKFRGKRIDNGEWIYGCLVQTINEGVYILNMPSFIPAKTLPAERFIKVHPESVGQYTGLKDKKGKEIYEGDIVSYTDVPTGLYNGNYEVIFDAGFIGINTVIKSNLCEIESHKYVEVIGNIHDNPELL